MENDLTLDAAVAAAMHEDQPVLQVPPSLDTTLPGGFIDDDGHLHTDARVRELTGADEEVLAGLFRGNDKPNLFDRFDTLLVRGVDRLGPWSGDEVTRRVVQQLLIGDRDWLAMQIRKATFGSIITGQVVCPTCTETNDVEIDLDDEETVPVQHLEDGNKRSFTVPLRHGSAEVRLGTGADQYAMGGSSTATLAETNTLLLSRCIISINGEDTLDNVDGPEAAVRALGMADRRTVLEFLAEQQPGPRLREVRVPCASCGVSIDAPVDLDVLLR